MAEPILVAGRLACHVADWLIPVRQLYAKPVICQASWLAARVRLGPNRFSLRPNLFGRTGGSHVPAVDFVRAYGECPGVAPFLICLGVCYCERYI